MAENNKDQNIFIGLLNAINPQKSARQDDPQKNVPQQFDPRGATSREDVQQKWLDWQVQKLDKDLYSRPIYFDSDRISAYQDYRAMDHSPEVRQALNIMRDECLTPNEYGEILQVYSDQERVKEALTELFGNRLNVNYMLKLWIRELLKYGDHFVLLEIDKDKGVVGLRNLPTAEIHREENYNNGPDVVRFRDDVRSTYYTEWQVAHFRLMEDSERLPYGRSILDAARKTWKQLQLAEDALLVYRITRAPDRRVFYIEVGNLAPDEIGPFIQAMQRSVKKAPVVDPRNGNKEFKYNPQNVSEDYFLPVRGEHHSRIDTLPGASNLGDIQDIEYLENKLFCSLVVPKAYLNFAEGLQGGTTLSQSDIRFARTIIGFQEVVLMELHKIAKVHLFLLGFKEDYENFTLKLNNPSTQMELMKLEIMKARLEVAKEWHSMDANSFASWTWTMENILSFSKNAIKKMLKQKKVEKKLFAEIDAAPETYRKTGIFKDIDQRYEIAGADPNGGTGSEGGGGGESDGFNASSALGDDGAGMDMGGGAPDLGGMEGGDMDAGGAAPAGGGDTQSAPEMALGENRKLTKEQRKQRLIEMIDELFEDDREEEAERAMIQRGKQNIIERGGKMMAHTESLMTALENKFGVLTAKDHRQQKAVMKDAMFVESDNPLLQNYNDQTAKLYDFMKQTEGMASAEEVILPDNTTIEEQGDVE